MSTPLLATKLHIPPLRAKVVLRSRLIERMNEGFLASDTPSVTLVSAPAGFGKTMLVSEWVADCGRREPKVLTAWLSLDEGDNDPVRFLAYVVAALRTNMPSLGAGLVEALQSTSTPLVESILTALINEIVALQDRFILVLDDYHVIEAQAVDFVLAFLLEHLPLQLHLVITTRVSVPVI